MLFIQESPVPFKQPLFPSPEFLFIIRRQSECGKLLRCYVPHDAVQPRGASGNMAVSAEYAEGIVRDKNVAPRAFSCQLVPDRQYAVSCIHKLLSFFDSNIRHGPHRALHSCPLSSYVLSRLS